ncbi:unnamed protein product [Nippostrongylus brasiliensis]|uniref:HOOK_N domain-containing protein n=1 Tax=Nippostrongylus brasiliensis TaxID=27835 RepID=A0A0N4YQL0_NIPBR|nr:unnamed protein product [Nippostrongylus brasiliensis]
MVSGGDVVVMVGAHWLGGGGDVSGEELNKFVLLLLGCAVQGDKKKTFVSRITNLEKRLQEGIAKEIQKITESSSVVLSIDSLARYDGGVADHIEKLMEQRDAYAQTLYQVADTESDGGGSSTESSSVNGEVEIRRKIEKRPSRRTPSPPYLDRHSTVELSAKNAELRKLRKETEDKDDRINELTDELEASEAEVRKLKDERIELVKDARAAKDLRDELDCVQQKLDRLEKLERENSQLHEKLTKLEYIQSQLEHQRADNATLEMSVEQLENELELLRQEKKNQTETQMRLHEAQQSIRCLQTDIGEKNSKIEELLVEQSRLEGELMCLNGKILEMESNTTSAHSRHYEIPFTGAHGHLLAETCSVSTLSHVEVGQKPPIRPSVHSTVAEREKLRVERDESVKSLIDARTKFAQFQTEFGRKFEQEAQTKVVALTLLCA